MSVPSTSGRARKRRRGEESCPTTAIMPLFIGRHWVVVAADTATGSMLIYDAGHAIDPTDAEFVSTRCVRRGAD